MNELKKNLDGSGMRIGIVQSRSDTGVCKGLLDTCCAQLVQQGVAENDITLASVPGVLEIPLVLLHMAESGRFDALIALGAVIRGDACHFEVLPDESARRVNEVQMDCGIPIANAILAADTDEQAFARMRVKGSEAALVAIEMANLLQCLA